MLKKIKLIGIIGFLMIGFSFGEEIEKILKKVEENSNKINTMKAKMIISTRYENKKNATMVQEVNYLSKKPDKIKMEMLKPMKQTIVYNGNIMYMKNPMDGKIIKQEMPKGSETEIFDFDKNIKKMIDGKEIVLKKTIIPEKKYVLESKFKQNTEEMRTEMIINAENGTVEGIEIFDKNEKKISVIKMEYKYFKNVWVPVKMINTIIINENNLVSEVLWKNISINFEIGNEEFILE
ncbi:MAG: hypothetical protein ABIB46_04420 [bacterium]